MADEALVLAAGSEVFLDGDAWTITELAPYRSEVVLASAASGQQMTMTIAALMNHRSCRPSSRTAPGLPAHARGRQPAGLSDLTDDHKELLSLRLAHLLEAETGYRSGSADHALPGEPRPAYDPGTTTLGDRRKTKVVELAELAAADPDRARRAGLARMSTRTLMRMAVNYRRFGEIGCVDGRWLRGTPGHVSLGEEVREAIAAVRTETLHRSKVSMATKDVLIRQYVAEHHGSHVQVPSYATLRRIWRDWYGSSGARPRYDRSAATVAEHSGGEHVVVYRPGQVVALDTTVLPVFVRESVFSKPVKAHLTLALDVYTHSVVGFRLTLVSDTSTDVAMMLRDVMMPAPMRQDWGHDMAWPYPGIPATLVAEFAGHEVAALPFFTPETITVDHGSVYKNHHLIEAQRVLGTNVRPARVLRPTDKAAVERAFGAIRTLLFEKLPGYSGVDPADAGADPMGDCGLTLPAMEHLIATWVVRVWQNRELGEHAPAWDPAGRHSPNTLFAASMAQGGFALQIPRPELFYQLLPAVTVSRIGPLGAKIGRLHYNGPGLARFRNQASTRGGAAKGRWVFKRDRRDLRAVYFQDPGTHEWHRIPWTGLPADGEVPAFGDARVEQVMQEAQDRGLTPRTDVELLPILLELLGEHAPVDSWVGKSAAKRSGTGRRPRRTVERISRPELAVSRENALGAAAAADRPTAAGADAAVMPLGGEGGSADANEVLRAHRRRLREAAVPTRPAPPPPLGASLQRGLFLVPDNVNTRTDTGTEDP